MSIFIYFTTTFITVSYGVGSLDNFFFPKKNESDDYKSYFDVVTQEFDPKYFVVLLLVIGYNLNGLFCAFNIFCAYMYVYTYFFGNTYFLLSYYFKKFCKGVYKGIKKIFGRK